MNSFKHDLLKIIRAYDLDRFDKWRNILYWLEYGNLDDDTCSFYLFQAKAQVEHLKETGNFLDRAPFSVEELYGPGVTPNLLIGKLIEKPEIELGLHLPPPLNMLVSGASGSGKSSTLRTIALMANKLRDTHNLRILYIDPKGDATAFPMYGSEWVVLNDQNLRIGLNNPVDVFSHKWNDVVGSILAARCGMKLAKSCFVGILNFLVGVLNKDHGSEPLLYPSIAEVLEAVKVKPIADFFSSRADYIKTLIQVLHGILNESNKIFSCRRGLDINNLFAQGKNVIFNTMQMGQSTAMIVVDLILQQLLQPRLINRTNPSRPYVLIIIDEADTLLDPGKTDEQFPHSMTPLQLILRLGRELRLIVCVGISSLLKLNYHITANMTYFFNLRTTDPKSLYCSMQTLQLKKGCENLLSGLANGQAVFKQALPSWHRPFLVQINYIPAPQDNASSFDMSVVNDAIPDDSIYNIPGIEEAIRKVAQANENTKLQTKRVLTGGSKLHDDAMATLQMAASMLYHPFLVVFRKLGITNSGYQDKICHYLEKEGLVVFEELEVWRLPKRLGYPTSKGFAEIGVPEPSRTGRGSLSHRAMAHWIKWALEAESHAVYIEYILPGTSHPVDVADLYNNTIDAYEIILTCTGTIESHVTKCFADCTEVRSLTFIVPLKKMIPKIKKILSGTAVYDKYKSNITIQCINDFYHQGK